MLTALLTTASDDEGQLGGIPYPRNRVLGIGARKV
jgi:hypothetical protein